jgi:hypothetical protein
MDILHLLPYDLTKFCNIGGTLIVTSIVDWGDIAKYEILEIWRRLQIEWLFEENKSYISPYNQVLNTLLNLWDSIWVS